MASNHVPTMQSVLFRLQLQKPNNSGTVLKGTVVTSKDTKCATQVQIGSASWGKKDAEFDDWDSKCEIPIPQEIHFKERMSDYFMDATNGNQISYEKFSTEEVDRILRDKTGTYVPAWIWESVGRTNPPCLPFFYCESSWEGMFDDGFDDNEFLKQQTSGFENHPLNRYHPEDNTQKTENGSVISAGYGQLCILIPHPECPKMDDADYPPKVYLNPTMDKWKDPECAKYILVCNMSKTDYFKTYEFQDKKTNELRTLKLEDCCLDSEDHWNSIKQYVFQALRSVPKV